MLPGTDMAVVSSELSRAQFAFCFRSSQMAAAGPRSPAAEFYLKSEPKGSRI